MITGTAISSIFTCIRNKKLASDKLDSELNSISTLRYLLTFVKNTILLEP